MVKMKKLLFFWLSAIAAGVLAANLIAHFVHKAPTEQSVTRWDAEKNGMVTFAKSLKVGDCYRTEMFDKAEHAFEKDHTLYSHVHVVLAADDKALLIAQPNPDCRELVENSQDCDYWFRTMDLDSPFLVTKYDKLVKCPEGLSRDEMIERLREDPSASKAYKVK